MDPQTSMDMTEAVMDAAFAAGMDPDFSELHILVDKATGDATVKSTSGEGKTFELAVSAADIASALGADVAEDAAEAPPAEMVAA